MTQEHIKIDSSTKTGSHHWLTQRLSAIALIPLVIWLVMSMVRLIIDPIYINVFFAYPLNAFMSILFVFAGLYHGALGMRVIVEDYISGKIKKHFYIILINFISIVTATATLVTILRLHLTV